MKTTLDIAKIVVSKLNTVSIGKLHKLCYYVYVWGLVWDDVELFKNDFVYTKSGPTSEILRTTFQGKFNLSLSDLSNIKDCTFSEDELETINAVCDFYKDYSFQNLVDIVILELNHIGMKEGDTFDPIKLQEYYGSIKSNEN